MRLVACPADCQVMKKQLVPRGRVSNVLTLMLLTSSLFFITILVTKSGPSGTSNEVVMNKDDIVDDNDYTGFLDDCYHVYLDVGSNVGIQVRKLFQPDLYPGAKLVDKFNHLFGNVTLNADGICAVGFEANEAHSERLEQIGKKFRNCGFRVHFFTQRAVSHRDHGHLAPFYSDGKKFRKEWGATLVESNVNLRSESMRKVKLLRLAKFVLEAVANRKLPNMSEMKQKRPTVLMKLDIEGSEVEVLTDLLLSGGLQHINESMVEFHDKWAGSEERKQLSLDVQRAMEVIAKASQSSMTPIQLSDFDDETYAFSHLPLPNCNV